RHVTQRQSALQGVEPNPASSSTSRDPQSGHAAGAPTSSSGNVVRPSGGAIPKPRSFPRADSRIQSVVHAGDSFVTTLTASYDASSATRTSCAMTSVAGQPEYVGVSVTV